MAKITLYPRGVRYRAVIGRSKVGWAYSLKQYREGDTDILEAVVYHLGKQIQTLVVL